MPLSAPAQLSLMALALLVNRATARLSTDEQIAEQVREATIRGEAVAFDSWVSQVRAATVQRDAGRGRGSNVAAIDVRTGSDLQGHPTP